MSTDAVGVARHHVAPAEAITSAMAVRIVNFVVILVPKGFILIFGFSEGFWRFEIVPREFVLGFCSGVLAYEFFPRGPWILSTTHIYLRDL